MSGAMQEWGRVRPKPPEKHAAARIDKVKLIRCDAVMWVGDDLR